MAIIVFSLGLYYMKLPFLRSRKCEAISTFRRRAVPISFVRLWQIARQQCRTEKRDFAGDPK